MSLEKNWQFELEEYIRQGEPDKIEKKRSVADSDWSAGSGWTKNICVSIRYGQRSY